MDEDRVWAILLWAVFVGMYFAVIIQLLRG